MCIFSGSNRPFCLAFRYPRKLVWRVALYSARDRSRNLIDTVQRPLAGSAFITYHARCARHCRPGDHNPYSTRFLAGHSVSLDLLQGPTLLPCQTGLVVSLKRLAFQSPVSQTAGIWKLFGQSQVACLQGYRDRPRVLEVHEGSLHSEHL